MSITNEYIYWLDIETTGLDPMRDVILEVAMVRTHFEEPTKPLATMHMVLGLQGSDPEDWHPKVREMHARSGLIDECRRSRQGCIELAQELGAFVPEPAAITESETADAKWTVAGSVVSFDLGFLQRHVPRIYPRFMHRTLDVSAVKLFCRTLGMPKLAKAEAHRAKDDIAESMAHLVLCRKWLAQPETPHLGWGRVGDRA